MSREGRGKTGKSRSEVNKLGGQKLKGLKPGRHNDGRGLYLHVRATGTRAWVFRYRDRATGNLRDMGLGSYPEVPLAAARRKTEKLRVLLGDGSDPIELKRSELLSAKLDRARAKTFRECRDAYVLSHRAGWRNAKHSQQWINSLETHAADLMPLPVQEIDTTLVLQALQPIWASKTETASRVRQRIEAVLSWATVRELRHGANPAQWRGHLEKLLPKPGKVSKPTPRAALNYSDMGRFWKSLVAVDTLASKALQLQILTATRPSEATGAHWSEFDLANNVWNIPGSRMKAGKDHRVPLSTEALSTLNGISGARDGWVFPGMGRTPGPISIAATLKLVKELGPGLTAHGFRSTFRDWAADQTAYRREVAEKALAHSVKDKAEASYQRSDMLERRARLMQDWATYCGTETSPTAEVTPIGKKRRETVT